MKVFSESKLRGYCHIKHKNKKIIAKKIIKKSDDSDTIVNVLLALIVLIFVFSIYLGLENT